MGWLYDSFVRGAEFWQVHDLLMKMVLTGMLIYIPTTSRAGIASLICVVACCNLNYFEPHKNKLLFWLSQISFIITTAKYIVALLLSSSSGASSSVEEQKIIGTMLIALDIGFIGSSVLVILLSLWVLRLKVNNIHKKGREARNNSTKITPATTRASSTEAHSLLNAQKLREIRVKHGASSKEYEQALTTVYSNVEEDGGTSGKY